MRFGYYPILLGIACTGRKMSIDTLRKKDRRDFFKRGMMLAGGIATMPAFMKPAFAHADKFGAYNIGFRNAHTGETFSGAYRVGNKYLPEAFDRINYIMRDFRTGDIKMIDPRLIDVLYFLHQGSGTSDMFEVISGYRSPKTNEMLRKVSTGVAKRSLHMDGKAVDIRLNSVRLSKLRKIAVDMKAGGVGYYPKSNFIHVDTGAIRSW